MQGRILSSLKLRRLEVLQKSQSLAFILSDLEGRVLCQEEGSQLPQKVVEILKADLSQGRVGLLLHPLETQAWEFCVAPGLGDKPLALHPRLSLIREVECAEPLPLKPFGFRVLVAMANPATGVQEPLDHAEAELQSVEKALKTAECRRWEVEMLRYADSASITRAVTERPPDVLHFIGHGVRKASGPALVMESGGFLYPEELAPGLAGTRIVVLSACGTGGASQSFATQLVRLGVPAVVGMQTALADQSGGLFSRAFYASLAEGAPVEEAVRQGRYALSGTERDWGSPVLTINNAHVLHGEDTVAVETNPALPDDDRPFIGRGQELRDVGELIKRHRLVSVVAMGGMGKTRLALQVARDGAGQWANGVRFVECDALGSEEDLSAALCAALENRSLYELDVRRSEVFQIGAEMEALVVLDCFEHLTFCADFIRRLTRACPRLHVLITSRVVLGLEAEKAYELGPLGGRKAVGSGAEGMQLFVSAAESACPGIKFNSTQKKLVKAIVQDLESVPLALLLAGARLRHMGIEDLTQRLKENRLDTLRRRPSGTADRHADLLRVIEDSLRLLSDEERGLTKSLSVFRGGFYLEDAREVVGEGKDLSDGITVLRDHHILLARHVGGRMRYRFLDTVREYLDRWPDSADQAACRDRHAHHAARLAGTIRADLTSGDWDAAREKLWMDVGNFRAATAYALARQDGGLVCDLARSLSRLYFEAGLGNEFSELAKVGMVSAREQGDLALQIEVLGLEGAGRRRSGQPGAAKVAWEERVRVGDQLGDARSSADTLIDLADLALAEGDTEGVGTALRRFDEYGIGDPKMLSSRLLIGARFSLQQGDRQQALALTRQAQAEHEKVPAYRRALYDWTSMAFLYRELGELTQSRAMCAVMISTSLTRNYAQSAGRGLLDLARAYLAENCLDSAAECLAVAHLMPKTISAQLKKECDELRVLVAADILNEADAGYAGHSWQDLAQNISARLRPTID